MITEHKILVGDCRETLKTLPAESAHVCVTSPPYWGLRDYQTGSTAEIGSEPTLDDHLANIVDVYREVRRVLRPDALSFLNYGDAFASSGGGDSGNSCEGGDAGNFRNSKRYTNKTHSINTLAAGGFKQKDLMCLPHRVAMALQADGWYLRQCVIWCKGSPMPESVRGSRWERCRVKVASSPRATKPSRNGDNGATPQSAALDGGPTAQWQPCPGCDKCRDTDGYVYRQSAGRPTTAHEFVFLLAKSPSYYYAMDENRVGLASPPHAPGNICSAHAGHKRNDFGTSRMSEVWGSSAGRNLWSYWTDISPSAFKDSHFATMPLDLARRCVKLGTSSVGVCSACGAPWAPVVENGEYTKHGQHCTRTVGDDVYAGQSPAMSMVGGGQWPKAVLAHRPTCTCNADKSPAVVLDPFGGAGTTAIAARELGHSSIICELNNEYAAMAKRRERRHFSKPKTGTAVKPATGQVELF